MSYREGDRLIRRQVRTRNGVYDIVWRVERTFTSRAGADWMVLRRLDRNSASQPSGLIVQRPVNAVDWMLRVGYEVVPGTTVGRA